MRVITLLSLLLFTSSAHTATITIPVFGRSPSTLASATPAVKISLTTGRGVAAPTGSHHTTAGGCSVNRTATFSVPKVTAPPAGGEFFEPLGGSGASRDDIAAKFRQTTYYSCVTWPNTVHCGWHEPILDASMDSAASRYGSRASAVRAGAVALVIAGLLLLA